MAVPKIKSILRELVRNRKICYHWDFLFSLKIFQKWPASSESNFKTVLTNDNISWRTIWTVHSVLKANLVYWKGPSTSVQMRNCHVIPGPATLSNFCQQLGLLFFIWWKLSFFEVVKISYLLMLQSDQPKVFPFIWPVWQLDSVNALARSERSSMTDGGNPGLEYAVGAVLLWHPRNTWKCSFSGSWNNRDLLLDKTDNKYPWSYGAARICLPQRETVHCHRSAQPVGKWSLWLSLLYSGVTETCLLYNCIIKPFSSFFCTLLKIVHFHHFRHAFLNTWWSRER